MRLRLKVWVLTGTLWAFSLREGQAASGFNLAERKQKQAWLWAVPREHAIPPVQETRWPAIAEDFFILAGLEKAGLKPAPAADERTWLRRAHFVITGLPPTREEIQAFLTDKQPEARARVVDEMLASPRYGERWARHWMDLVRYAESRGHEGDYAIANAWQYRDYLIRAFNDDVPYDQFVLEHIAGDLLAKPRFRPGTEINESVVATGWPFLGEENHSPVDIRGDECDRIDNKVDVFSKTFLGLTVSCARCHDHKFDPIRAQDYYALSGFMLGSSYRQVRFEAMENNRARADEMEALRASYAPRLMRAVAEGSAEGVSNIARNLMEARDCLAADRNSAGSEALARWRAHLRAAATNAASPLRTFSRAALNLPKEPGQSGPAELPADARIIADYTRPDQQPWKVDGEAFGRRPMAAGDIVMGTDPSSPMARVMTYGAARRDLFWNRLRTSAGNENDSGRLAATARSGQMLRTPTVTLDGGRLHYLIRGKTRVYASVDSHLMVEGPLHGVLVKTFESGRDELPHWVTHDLSAYSGHRVHVEFGPEGDGELEVLMVVEAPEAPRWTPKIACSEITDPQAFADSFQAAVRVACEEMRAGRIAPAEAVYANWLVQNQKLIREREDGGAAALGQKFIEAQTEIERKVLWESQTAVAWFDGTGVDENILLRGKPFKPGLLAPRALPGAFPGSKPITCATSSGRYELGLQLVDPANPLVARVMVNRVWYHIFGRGIVASVDNFGELGDRPTHPELLDHLAWQFVHEDGWSLKRLIKRLVLSSTFGMSSATSDPAGDERDPANLLLHRMAVRRLEGEAIRDALLAVSGRLSPKVGGPPEPMFLTDFLVGRGRPDKSGPLDGDGRRSIYMAMHRNFLPTFMQTFDAPTPFSTVGKRNVTNVPAQSLAMMNDPLFHQQAEMWAERLLRETSGADASTRLAWLFESAYGRLPTEQEAADCLGTLRELATMLNGKPKEIWAELCHALLNSNEFIYVK